MVARGGIRGDGPGQLPHYIPNRKRDKANKTLSGRRSANTAPPPAAGPGVAVELKLGTKVLTFVPEQSFSNYGRGAAEKDGKGKEDGRP